jgi:BirA family transcriptional regulator, biotin operon repressor / biotin---[acetyl-CoA-carboxylase] ligase
VFDLPRITASGLIAQIDYHESLPSTSDRALELAAHGESRIPLLVLTSNQTAGRGRGTHRWQSADGALTFSLVFEADPSRLPTDRWPQVPLVVGLAVCEALESLPSIPRLGLKWPNDVLLADRKVAGILAESVPGWRDRLVVGIGINVNNSIRWMATGAATGRVEIHSAEFSTHLDDVARTAIALIDHDGAARDLTTTLLTVLDQIDRRWQELLSAGFAPLAADYKQRCLLTGRTITITEVNGSAVTGICHGIDEAGLLRIQSQNGERRIVSGTVSRWR